MSSVLVKMWLGSRTFARATADCFTKDTLTVTWLDTEMEACELPPGEWQSATVISDDGYPLFVLETSARPRQLREREVA